MHNLEKVGFLPRLAAYLIDIFILSVAAFLLGLIVGLGVLISTLGISRRTLYYASNNDVEVLAQALALILVVTYWLFFWTRWGQTPGKMVMGIKVVSTDGSPIGLAKAVARLFGYWLSGLALGLGHLWIIWDANKQGWQDKIAGTYVVKVRPSTATVQSQPAVQPSYGVPQVRPSPAVRLQPWAQVVIMSGSQQGTRYSIGRPQIALGRDPRCDVPIRDDIYVSPLHARIWFTPQGYVIEDAGSLNGTYVNRQRITRQFLRHGDEIWLGYTRLIFQSMP